MGGKREFDEFYGANFHALVGQVTLVTASLEDAEDAVQEAFVRAAMRWGRVGAYDAPEFWVRRVAYNLAISELRKRRVRRRSLETGRSVSSAPELSTESLALMTGLRQLPLRQRECLVLHYAFALTVEEVAAELGVPAGSVKSWLARGRRSLASVLNDEEVEHERG